MTDSVVRGRQTWTNRLAPVGIHAMRPHEEERLLERFIQAVSGDYIPLCLIVNEQMEVQHIIGEPDRYFRLPTGKLQNDISRMAVKELSIPLASGLQKVFRNGEEIKYSNIRVNIDGETRLVQMRLRLLPGKRSQEALAAVLLSEETEQTTSSMVTATDPLVEYDINRETEQRIHDLEQELQFTRENLQATIEELETTNEELQATNEELLASNEELQSTNEELQSVNEELHTVNAEYQSKILDLTELNNDIDNLMASTQIATLFLDENLNVRRFTPDIQPVMQLLPTDVGRPITHLSHQLRDVDPLMIIRDVQRTGNGRTLEVQTHGGVWYVMRVLPYRVRGGAISGVVVLFIDIDQLKSTKNALDISEARLNSLLNSAQVAIVLEHQGVIAELNQRTCELTGYNYSELFGQPLDMLFNSPDETQRIMSDVDRAVNHPVVVESEWRTKSGEGIPVLLSASLLYPARPEAGRTWTVIDIRPRKEAVKLAKRSEAFSQALMDHIQEAVLCFDETGVLISVNPAAAALFGMTSEQMLGLRLDDALLTCSDEHGMRLSDGLGIRDALRSGAIVQKDHVQLDRKVTPEHSLYRIVAIPLYGMGRTEPDSVGVIITPVQAHLRDSHQLSLGNEQ